MNKRLIAVAVCTILFLLTAVHLKQMNLSRLTFGSETLKYGSSGGDVYELQGRLKYLGFYHGDIDGDFGSKTLQSVKNFQYQFGMKADGIVGGKTKVKLWEATKDWSPDRTPRKTEQAAEPQPAAPSPEAGGGSQSKAYQAQNRLGLSEQDLNLMANAVYGEARGEPYIGQVAVAAVILNRVESPSFPNTVSGVIFQPGAFTAVADGQIWLTPNETAKKAVMDALNGYDPTGGCIYYFNPSTATSKWIWSRPQVKTIGKHIFCM
jgi:N-acetylmuramoyl-L-alanine amidase